MNFDIIVKRIGLGWEIYILENSGRKTKVEKCGYAQLVNTISVINFTFERLTVNHISAILDYVNEGNSLWDYFEEIESYDSLIGE